MRLVPPEESGAYAEIEAIVAPMARRFADAGHHLYLVGGVVRDLLLDRHGAADDIDCTTDARPETIKQLLREDASALWTQGEKFGTIGATIDGRALEVTTHRAESYDATSRKPVVAFGDDLGTDLSRRDFTINAMAIDAADGTLHDPYGGRDDLAVQRLATPLDPHVSFTDDPLRMLRAARFVPRFDLVVDPALEAAVTEMAPRLEIVSVERCHDELERLLALPTPASGLRFAMTTGLLSQILPGFDAVRHASSVEVAGTPMADGPLLDARARRVALLAPLDAADVLAHLRYSVAERRASLAMTSWLAKLAGRDARPGDGDLRRLVDECGDDARVVVWLASRLGDLDEAAVDARFVQLSDEEDLSDLEPPVSGGDLIAALGLHPGPLVGQLVTRLRDHRLDVGPFDRAEALRLAARWADSTSGPDDVRALR